MIIEKATEFSRDFEVKNPLERSALLFKAVEFLKEEVRETEEAIGAEDRAEIVDGFGDVAFVAINGIYKEFRSSGESHETATLKTKQVLDRICNANLGKKQSDGTIKYKNGKVQKPAEWRAPEYKDIL